ncbi:MAG: NADH-quinone oxidoreductase subunit J [Candidatus Sumerlaeaceae bacterium]|nr:NADH-quinone oxidoreductase subunit J [Candidatus Sumerlaeaceae bacterium]
MLLIMFYIAAIIAVVSTGAVIFSRNPVYSVIYLIISLFAVAMVFYTLGAPFLAMAEIIIYAGAIMVLFLFVVMMLNLGQNRKDEDLQAASAKALVLPLTFTTILAMLTVLALAGAIPAPHAVGTSSAALGKALFDKHFLGVKLAAFILLVGSIGGMHLGRASSTPDTKETRI